MKIGKPIQEIKKLCASQGIELSNEEREEGKEWNATGLHGTDAKYVE